LSSPVIRQDPATGTLVVVYIGERGQIGAGGVYMLTKP